MSNPTRSNRHADPPPGRPESVYVRPAPLSYRAFSSRQPATVLPGVKVVRPVGRSTLTPSAVRRSGQLREGGGNRDSSSLDTARPHGLSSWVHQPTDQRKHSHVCLRWSRNMHVIHEPSESGPERAPNPRAGTMSGGIFGCRRASREKDEFVHLTMTPEAPRGFEPQAPVRLRSLERASAGPARSGRPSVAQPRGREHPSFACIQELQRRERGQP